MRARGYVRLTGFWECCCWVCVCQEGRRCACCGFLSLSLLFLSCLYGGAGYWDLIIRQDRGMSCIDGGCGECDDGFDDDL